MFYSIFILPIRKNRIIHRHHQTTFLTDLMQIINNFNR